MISLVGTAASEAPQRVHHEGTCLISGDSEVPRLSTYKLHAEEQAMHHLVCLSTEQGWGQAAQGRPVSQMQCIRFGSEHEPGLAS